MAMEQKSRPSLAVDESAENTAPVSSRKSSTSDPAGTVPDQVAESISRQSDPAVREGLVKGYGGAIEKTLADQAANKVKLRTRKPVADLSLKEAGNKPVLLSNRESKVLDGSLDGMMVDSGLTCSLFSACAKNETASVIEMVKDEPRLVRVGQPGTSWTALHWAARYGNTELARFLVGDYKADPKALSRAGYTPLHVAALYLKVDMMAILTTEYGAEQDLTDYSGKTAAYYLRSASKSGRAPNPSSSDLVNRKPKTITNAFSTSIRRVGSFNARMRSSVMRRFTASAVNIKESVSSPGPFLPEESGADAFLMPPPLLTVPGLKRHPKRQGGVGLMRHGSMTSQMSRSDSTISVDDLRSLGSERNGKLFDSESDTASYQGSDSVDFPASLADATTSPRGDLFGGKTSSPVVYAKTLSSQDGGSEV